jgi:hypothetical protein
MREIAGDDVSSRAAGHIERSLNFHRAELDEVGLQCRAIPANKRAVEETWRTEASAYG